MRWQVPLTALGVLILACGPGEEQAATEPSTDALLQPAVAAAANVFTANLNGGQEVPAVETRARGEAEFQVNTRGGEGINFRLVVANIEDVLMAHIHLAPTGVNGPIVVWLYPPAPPPQLIPGQFNGVLAERTITAADLVGPLAGLSLDDLVAEMEAGNTYVNVHTVANPAGEIRGQISSRVRRGR